MPQSLANVLVHLVFSTKNRERFLKDEWRDDLHAYFGGIIHQLDGEILAVNSVEDHVHMLLPLPRTVALADLVRELKAGTSRWVKTQSPALAHFHWQSGYGAFSVSPSHKQAVLDYIAGQREHHRAVTFQEEYRRMLTKYGMKWDERYVWD